MFPLAVDPETELRVLSEPDAPEFHRLLVASLPHLRPWFEFARSEQPYEESLAFIRRTQQRYSDGGGFWAGIRHTGRLVGAVGLTQFDAANESAELSYWLSKPATGRGLATRACAAMLDDLFSRRKLNRVGIRCAAENLRSTAIALRLGFRPEGVMRQAERSDRRFRDVALYGLLRQEWRTTTP